MDRRTKILATLLLAMGAYWLISSVIYPKWVRPMLTIEDRVAEAKKALDDLEDGEAEVEQAKREYRRYLDRVGSFDAANIEIDLRERLNMLINQHKLDEMTVTGGSARLSSFGKTDAKRMVLTVAATGTLEGCVGFLKSVSELPHLIQVGNMTLFPASTSRRTKGKHVERMQLRLPIEVLVLPQQKILGEKLADADLDQPERVVRHQERNYALIWDKTPFTEYIKLEPLVVDAGADLTADVGKRGIMIDAKATGGDGDYTIHWDPVDKLSDPNSFRPRIDTSEAFTQVYTLTVSDTSDNTGTDQVEITIREKTPLADGGPVERPPVDTGPKRWPDGSQQQLVMALISRDGNSRQDEIMLYHSRTRQNTYLRPGDEFDGGELLFVHPRGTIVRRQNDYFVYPIGGRVSDGVKAQDAAEYPKLQELAALISHAVEAQEAEMAPAENAATEGPTVEASDATAPGDGGKAGTPQDPKAPVQGPAEPAANTPSRPTANPARAGSPQGNQEAAEKKPATTTKGPPSGAVNPAPATKPAGNAERAAGAVDRNEGKEKQDAQKSQSEEPRARERVTRPTRIKGKKVQRRRGSLRGRGGRQPGKK